MHEYSERLDSEFTLELLVYEKPVLISARLTR